MSPVVPDSAWQELVRDIYREPVLSPLPEQPPHEPTFRERMMCDTGSPVPVWLYLLEKVTHTTAIAMLLFVSPYGLSLECCALIAAAVYLVASKIVVRFQQKDWGTFWKDGAFYRRFVFIAATLAVVPVYAYRLTLSPIGWALLYFAWLFTWLALEASGWAGT